MISISVSLQLSLRDLTTLFMELFSNNEQQLEIILSLIIVKCHTNLVSIVNYKSKKTIRLMKNWLFLIQFLKFLELGLTKIIKLLLKVGMYTSSRLTHKLWL